MTSTTIHQGERTFCISEDRIRDMGIDPLLIDGVEVSDIIPYMTKNYNTFRFSEANRSLRRQTARVRKLYRSLQESGFLPFYAILVKWDRELSKFIILDGHHRFKEASELKLRVYFYVLGKQIIDLFLINTSASPFTAEDAVSSYAPINVHYFNLDIFSKHTGMPLVAAAELLCGVAGDNGGGSVRQRLIEGGFVITHLEEAKITGQTFKLITELVPSTGRASNLVGALKLCRYVQGWDEEDFRRRLKIHINKFTPQSTRLGYIQKIQEIFNISRKSGNEVWVELRLREQQRI